MQNNSDHLASGAGGGVGKFSHLEATPADMEVYTAAGVSVEVVRVPAWKLRRAAEILERDGDEYGVAADLRAILASKGGAV